MHKLLIPQKWGEIVKKYIHPESLGDLSPNLARRKKCLSWV